MEQDIQQVQLTPEEQDAKKREAAESVMQVVHDYFEHMGWVKRVYKSSEPREYPSEYVMTLFSPLLGKKRQEIGTIRAFVRVPRATYNDAWVKIEWTRNAFGFWFSDESIVKDVVEDPEGANYRILKKPFMGVGWTVRGSVPLRSMVRSGYKKVKKNRTKDRITGKGLRLG